MKKSLVAGFKGASFKGVDFAKFVTSWEDTRQPLFAVHKYNKRDGGEGEYMGRKPHEVNVRLAYIGVTWRDDFLKLQEKIDDSPSGSLVHPVYGSMNAICLGHQGARMDLENSPNFYEVPLHFIESAVDTKVTSDSQAGPAEKEQKVTTVSAALVLAGAQFPTALPSIDALTAAAITYAAAVVSSAQTVTADASLPQQLASIETLTETAITAVQADPAAIDSAVTADTIAFCEQLYDACTQVDDSVRSLRPSIFLYTIPMRIHITNLARVFYGKDGAAREDEILANNPGKIPDPGLIPAGVQLLMAVPTV